MATDSPDEQDRWALRGAYSLVMGLGAFFAYFNESHRWVQAPDYPRLSDLWFDPLEPVIRPYLAGIVVVLGVLFLAYSGYCFYRYASSDPAGG